MKFFGYFLNGSVLYLFDWLDNKRERSPKFVFGKLLIHLTLLLSRLWVDGQNFGELWESWKVMIVRIAFVTPHGKFLFLEKRIRP